MVINSLKTTYVLIVIITINYLNNSFILDNDFKRDGVIYLRKIFFMENFTRRWKWSISVLAIGLLTIYGCSDVVMIEELKETQESFDRNAPIDFSGCVIDPLTCEPVANATVTSGATTLTTDADGKFHTKVEVNQLSNTVQVEKEGHVPFSFFIDYSEYDGDIRIDLPTQQSCVWIGPSEGAWYKVSTNDDCVTYIVDIFAGSVDKWVEICIGPGGNAYGNGVDLFFSQPSISIDTPDEEDVEFLKDVDVRIDLQDLLDAANKSMCLAEESSLAIPGLQGLTDPDDILTVLFGSGNFAERIGDRLISTSQVSGTIIPGVGIIGTDEEAGGFVIFPFLAAGGGIGAPIPFPDNDGPSPDLPGTPHQSVADGDG